MPKRGSPSHCSGVADLCQEGKVPAGLGLIASSFTSLWLSFRPICARQWQSPCPSLWRFLGRSSPFSGGSCRRRDQSSGYLTSEDEVVSKQCLSPARLRPWGEVPIAFPSHSQKVINCICATAPPLFQRQSFVSSLHASPSSLQRLSSLCPHHLLARAGTSLEREEAFPSELPAQGTGEKPVFKKASDFRLQGYTIRL